MGLYNFKPQFVPMILAGTKTHTIRAERKYSDKPGDTMHLYTGLRQKGTSLLGRSKCVKVERIDIFETAALSNANVFIDGARLDSGEKEALAKRDGFQSFAEMIKFWDGRLPFTGHVFHWEAL